MSAIAGSGMTKHSHALGRVADGFRWDQAMDQMYQKDNSLYQKASFSSSDSGINNQAFGEALWQQANVKTPLWGLFPKIPADSPVDNIHDPRQQTFRAVFNPPAHSGSSEGSAWSNAVKFDTREVAAEPHEVEMLFEGTILQEIQSEIQDGVPFQNLTQIGNEYFERSLEKNALAVPNESSGGTGTQYSDLNDICPLDKIISSYDEIQNADDTTGTAYNAGDGDIYDIDRSATGDGGDNEANWADAVVDHNSGSGDRQLTADLVNDTLDALQENGANLEDLVIFTGINTARVLSDLRESQFRADALAQAVASAVDRNTDEAQTRIGKEFTARISHWDTIPVVQGPNVPTDTLERIYILDMSEMQDPRTGERVPKIGIEQYMPFVTESAGLGQPTNTLAIDKKANQVGLYGVAEPVCRRFNHQGKIRDLKE